MDRCESTCRFRTVSSDCSLMKIPAPRKRKPESDQQMRHVVKMTWDVDEENTSIIMDDMGVSQLEEKSSKQTATNPTPHVPTQITLVPPGAPRITTLLSTTPEAGTSCSSLAIPRPNACIEPQGTTDGLFFLSRRLPSNSVQDAGINHLDKLSDEMLLSILKWLSKPILVRCSRVCKRWHRLTMDETLWRRLDLNGKILKKGVLGLVLQRGVAVCRLAKTEIRAPLFTDPCGIFSNQRFSKVQYLDLTMSVIGTQGLEELLSTCHLLRKLSIENCDVSDNICRHIGSNINLEVLNLSMCQGITENGLVPLCNNLQRLDSLNVAWTNMSRGTILYLVTCLPKSITKLNMSGCKDALLDEDIQQLCNSCRGIKELDSSDATLLTGLSVQYMVSLLHGLEYLALSRCYHVMPSSLPLLSHIPTLLAVDVFGMLRESALVHLREALPNIEVNKFPFSSIARPTTGIRRTSIWGLRVRDIIV